MSRTLRKCSTQVSLVIATAMCFVASTVLARLIGPNLFVAGDGFTLEQAVQDAASQRTEQDSKTYKLLVVGSELKRITGSGATRDVRDLLSKAAKAGAQVFVCVKDLKASGLRPADLLPGVRPVRGFQPEGAEPLEGWEKKLPRAPDRKMLGICANN